MPELPEVEGFRRYISSSSLNKKITAVSHIDEKTLQVSTAEFEKAVAGKFFTYTKRIGKYLFLQLSDGESWVMMHCGMSGKFEYFNDLELLPKYTRLLYHFENGYHLAFIDPRKFGKVDLTSDVESYRKQKKLGLDVLNEMDQEAFIKILLRRSGKMKSMLMNQSLFPGIGNWIADEILFQANIHPQTDSQALTVEDYILLYEKLQHALKIALDTECNYEAFPDYFLVNHRKDGVTSPNKKGNIERLEVNGRGTYINPQTQVLKLAEEDED